MHLWPSMRIRDSFKIAYLRKLEWNLHRMNSEKQRSQQQQRFLDEPQENGVVPDTPSASSKTDFFGKCGLICREILMVLSCCYCCFCCGACVDEVEV